jgi:glycosyltransferase involved in cell wall biosynthesis
VPRVSVVVPTYDRASTVTDAIESVLNQTLDDLECIVVDDGSTDGTQRAIEELSDPRLRYRRHETNRGGSAARNTGIRDAEGRYVAFLDSDDEWLSTKLEREVGLLEGRSGDWVAAYCDVIRERSNPLVNRLDSLFPETTGAEGGMELVPQVLSMELSVYAGSTLLTRREAVESVGGFDESFARHQDLEFLVRLLQRGKLGYVDEPLVRVQDSGTPSVETLVDAKRRLLATFAHEVERAEATGTDVRGAHALELTKAALREGKFCRAAGHLRRAKPTGMRQLAGVPLAANQGLRSRLGR